MPDSSQPLNGRKMHPLSATALGELTSISWQPKPSMSVNPGVTDRLLRGGLVEQVYLPSPFKTRKGVVSHLRITEAGRAALSQGEPRDDH